MGILRRSATPIVWTFTLLASFLFLQICRNSIPGDSQVFYMAGGDVREGVNPWLASADATNFQYLNGPMNALLCAFLSIFGNRLMYLLVCGSSILVIPIIVHQLSKLMKVSLSPHAIVLCSVFLLSSFTVRANLQYGQFVVLYVVLLMRLLNLNSLSQKSKFQMLSLGLLPILLMDFKPHLFFPFLILLWPNLRDKFFVIGLTLGASIEILLTRLLTGEFLPFDWVHRIYDRGANSDNLKGFYNSGTFMRALGLPSSLGIIIISIILLSTIMFIKKNKSNVLATSILAYFILFPALHPQDFVFLFAIFILFAHSKLYNSYVAFIIGMALVWSSNSLLVIIFCLMVTFIITLTMPENNRLYVHVFRLFLLISAPSLLVLLVGISFDDFRIIANYLSVLFGLTWLMLNQNRHLILQDTFQLPIRS